MRLAIPVTVAGLAALALLGLALAVVCARQRTTWGYVLAGVNSSLALFALGVVASWAAGY